MPPRKYYKSFQPDTKQGGWDSRLKQKPYVPTRDRNKERAEYAAYRKSVERKGPPFAPLYKKY